MLDVPLGLLGAPVLAALSPNHRIPEFVISIGLFGVVTFVYLAGHFVVARWRDLRIEQFAIFFGGAIVKFHAARILWRINWIPLGGYMKFSGFREPDAPIPSGLGTRVYDQLSPPERIAILIAAPLATSLLACITLGPTGAMQTFCDCFTSPYHWSGNPKLAQPAIAGFLQLVHDHHYLRAAGILAVVNTAINILPVPIVTGGLILTELVQWISRRRVPERWIITMQGWTVFPFLLAMLVAFVCLAPALYRVVLGK